MLTKGEFLEIAFVSYLTFCICFMIKHPIISLIIIISELVILIIIDKNSEATQRK